MNRRNRLFIMLGFVSLLIVLIGGYWCSEGLTPTPSDVDVDGGCALIVIGGVGIILAIGLVRLQLGTSEQKEVSE